MRHAREYLAELVDARCRMRSKAAEGNRYMMNGILQARAESASVLDKHESDELARAQLALESHKV